MRRQKGLVAGGQGSAVDLDPAVGRCCLRPGNPSTERCEHGEINYEIRGARACPPPW